jgi:putative membrane protein
VVLVVVISPGTEPSEPLEEPPSELGLPDHIPQHGRSLLTAPEPHAEFADLLKHAAQVAWNQCAAPDAIMLNVPPPDLRDVDYRFSLANERTFLAWIRTAVALLVGGVVAAKALHFHHEVWRWVLAAPPVVAGALLAADAARRWRTYEDAMRAGRPLPVGRGVKAVGFFLCAYGILALVVSILDG